MSEVAPSVQSRRWPHLFGPRVCSRPGSPCLTPVSRTGWSCRGSTPIRGEFDGRPVGQVGAFTTGSTSEPSSRVDICRTCPWMQRFSEKMSPTARFRQHRHELSCLHGRLTWGEVVTLRSASVAVAWGTVVGLAVGVPALPASAECIEATVQILRSNMAPIDVVGPGHCVYPTPWPQVVEVPLSASVSGLPTGTPEGAVVYLALPLP